MHVLPVTSTLWSVFRFMCCHDAMPRSKFSRRVLETMSRKKQCTSAGEASCTPPFQAHQHVHRLMPESKSERDPCSSFILRVPEGADVVYVCQLCPAATINARVNQATTADTALRFHCNSSSHVERVNEVKRMQRDEMIVWTAKLLHRMESLSMGAWQRHVQGKLFHVLLNYRAWDIADFSYEHLKLEAELLISQHENNERMVQLALAIWKALCMASLNPERDDQKNNYYWWTAWYTSGWKCCKSQFHESREIQTILLSVVPFLRHISHVQSFASKNSEAMPFKAYQHANTTILQYEGNILPYSIARSDNISVHKCEVCEESILTQEVPAN
jgi:hypothetical protein